jgi:hypothetical protein
MLRMLWVGALAAVLALALGSASALADLPDNDIKILPVGASGDGSVPDDVGSRQPTINMQFNFGGMSGLSAECSGDRGAFGSCGTPVTPCPVTECFAFRPTFATDGAHTVEGAIFDPSMSDPSNPTAGELDQLGLPINVDSTPPDTQLGAASPQFDLESRNRAGVPVAFNFKTIDDADDIIYEDSAQCAFTTGAAHPSSWFTCDGNKQRLPVSSRIYRFWVRAVDFLGRPDPTPAESPPFSPIACRAKLASHPRSLRQVLRHGLRLRVSCIQPSRYGSTLLIPLREAEALNRKHPDISSQELGTVSGRVKKESGSQTVTLHLLRRIPADLLALRHLSLILETVSSTGLPSDLRRVTGQ